MSIKKVKGLESNFSIIPNNTVNDSLSWGAKGLLAYLCSKPDDWSVSVAQLCNHSKLSSKPTGRDGTYTIINELIDKGYMQRVQGRSTGKFQNTEYIVSATPLTDLPHTDKAHTVEPCTVEPCTVKPTLQSKDNNKEQTTTKKSNKKDLLFDQFWKSYDYNKEQAKCRKKFVNFTYETINKILSVVDLYVKSTPTKQYRKKPWNWLQTESWNDEIQAQLPMQQDINKIGSNFAQKPKGWQ